MSLTKTALFEGRHRDADDDGRCGRCEWKIQSIETLRRYNAPSVSGPIPDGHRWACWCRTFAERRDAAS